MMIFTLRKTLSWICHRKNAARKLLVELKMAHGHDIQKTKRENLIANNKCLLQRITSRLGWNQLFYTYVNPHESTVETSIVLANCPYKGKASAAKSDTCH